MPTKMTGARLFGQILKAYGVTHLFFMDAVLRRALAEMEDTGIHRILGHSEKAVAYMADGYARVSGRPGVVLAIAVAVALAWSGTQYLTDTQFLSWNKSQSGVETTASGLQYKVLVEGKGEIEDLVPKIYTEVFETAYPGRELDAASRDAVASCDHLFVGYDELVPTSGAVQKFMGFLKFLR